MNKLPETIACINQENYMQVFQTIKMLSSPFLIEKATLKLDMGKRLSKGTDSNSPDTVY